MQGLASITESSGFIFLRFLRSSAVYENIGLSKGSVESERRASAIFQWELVRNPFFLSIIVVIWCIGSGF